ncbi:MAG: CpXC domain-containing protein [Acidobacteriia bacterium]|jgi:hypothetical protein|nr:CpXC domain-containing protein [Terriglobia bacterium]
MSSAFQKSYTCSCGEGLEVTLWQSVNTGDPELCRQLLDGRLNVVFCKKCQRAVFIPVPLLYNDMERGFMIWIYDSRFSENPIRQMAYEPERIRIAYRFSKRLTGIKARAVDGFGWALEALRRIDDPRMLNRIREKHPHWPESKLWLEAFRRHYKAVRRSGWDRDRLWR